MNEQCRQVHNRSLQFFKELPSNEAESTLPLVDQLKTELERLEELMKGLPSEGAGDVDVEMVGKQLEEEMKRMGEAIAAAVAHIDELQKKRLEI